LFQKKKVPLLGCQRADLPLSRAAGGTGFTAIQRACHPAANANSWRFMDFSRRSRARAVLAPERDCPLRYHFDIILPSKCAPQKGADPAIKAEPGHRGQRAN
jgi:hypothetical protein